MKRFFEKNKKKIISYAITILIVIAISLLSLLILWLCGIIKFDDGVQFDQELFNGLKGNAFGWILFILFQTSLTMLLCAIPGISMAFILLSVAVFDYSWQAFLISFVSVMLSSFTLYLVGYFGGFKLCEKFLGKEDCEKSLSLYRRKGSVYFPLMMMFPAFPDDALVMVAGTIKMRLSWFIPSIVIGRGIGIAAIVFGFELIPFESFTSFYDWLVCGTVMAFWVFIIFAGAKKLNDKLEKRSLEKEYKVEEEEI